MSHLLPSSGSAICPVLHSSAAFYSYSHSAPRHTCHLDSYSGSVTGLQPSPSRLSLTYSSQSQNGNMIIKARVTKVPSSHKPLPGPLLRKAREARLSSALSPASHPTSLHRDTIALLSPTQHAARDAMLMRVASCARGFIRGHRLHLGVLPCKGSQGAQLLRDAGSFPPPALTGFIVGLRSTGGQG